MGILKDIKKGLDDATNPKLTIPRTRIDETIDEMRGEGFDVDHGLRARPTMILNYEILKQLRLIRNELIRIKVGSL